MTGKTKLNWTAFFVTLMISGFLLGITKDIISVKDWFLHLLLIGVPIAIFFLFALRR